MQFLHPCTPVFVGEGLILPAMRETVSQTMYKVLLTWDDTINGSDPPQLTEPLLSCIKP